jgi:hypothetical protein
MVPLKETVVAGEDDENIDLRDDVLIWTEGQEQVSPLSNDDVTAPFFKSSSSCC